MREDLWSWEWPAPAKVNLFLHVVGRREDGYHLLQTLFRLIDWHDTLKFRPRPDGEVRLTTPFPGLSDSDELSVRAARALQQATGYRRGVEITLEKRIPIGGGLGGGSSDAATALLALNALWELDLDKSSLSALALDLGADVPFFLEGQNAFAEGVGERLTPIALAPAWYVVLVPPVAVSTREIFSAPGLTANSKIVKISSLSSGFGVNDLEPVVRDRYPIVAAHLAWLNAHGAARLSGSGACVFAEFSTEFEARSVLASRPAAFEGFVAAGLDRHPAFELLARHHREAR